MQIPYNKLSAIPHYTILYSTSFIYISLKMYNVLAAYLKNMTVLRFKHVIKNILHLH